MRGRKIGVDTSPSNCKSGEIGIEVMFKEELVNKAGMDGHVAWAFAIAIYESGRGKRVTGAVALTGRAGGGVA